MTTILFIIATTNFSEIVFVILLLKTARGQRWAFEIFNKQGNNKIDTVMMMVHKLIQSQTKHENRYK